MKFKKIDEIYQGTEIHKTIIEKLNEQIPSLSKDLLEHIENTNKIKAQVKCTNILTDFESKEMLNAIDSLNLVLEKLIHSCAKNIVEFNSMIDEYESYMTIIEYWDKTYDEREKQMKDGNTTKNTIH